MVVRVRNRVRFRVRVRKKAKNLYGPISDHDPSTKNPSTIPNPNPNPKPKSCWITRYGEDEKKKHQNANNNEATVVSIPSISGNITDCSDNGVTHQAKCDVSFKCDDEANALNNVINIEETVLSISSSSGEPTDCSDNDAMYQPTWMSVLRYMTDRPYIIHATTMILFCK